MFARLIDRLPRPVSTSARRIFAMQGYLPALFALTTAMIVHFAFALTIGIGPAGIFFLYLMAVLIAAWCGYGPGLLVLFLALVVAPYTYRKNFSPRQVDPAGAGVLLLVTLITSQVSAHRRHTEALLRSVNQELDRRVRQQMLDLENAHNALRRQFAELETVYRQIPVGICFLDTELRFVRINEKLAEVNGASVSAHAGRCLRDMLPGPLADTLEPLYRRVLDSGQSLIDYEVNGPSPAEPRRQRSWNLDCSRVETDDGAVLGLQVIVLDVTERNQAQRALSRANEELAQFAYIAAHDLQEPLRTVVAYSQLIQRRNHGRVDADTSMYLDMVITGAKRMSQLITAVLDYSRVTAESERNIQKVNLEDVFASVTEGLKAAISENNAQLVHDPLPVVEGDAARLWQVFHNLIANALKYRRPDLQPVIRVSAGRRNGEWVFSVRDNGQGFHQEYSDRIFGMFKRLHGQDVPGSGVGLAICKAVVERHGGRIWAESEEGKGATFIFTLPANGVVFPD
jgi:PAS domain S-box-containing protein